MKFRAAVINKSGKMPTGFCRPATRERGAHPWRFVPSEQRSWAAKEPGRWAPLFITATQVKIRRSSAIRDARVSAPKLKNAPDAPIELHCSGLSHFSSMEACNSHSSVRPSFGPVRIASGLLRFISGLFRSNSGLLRTKSGLFRLNSGPFRVIPGCAGLFRPENIGGEGSRLTPQPVQALPHPGSPGRTRPKGVKGSTHKGVNP